MGNPILIEVEGRGAPRILDLSLRTGERLQVTVPSFSLRDQAVFINGVDSFSAQMLVAAQVDLKKTEGKKSTDADFVETERAVGNAVEFLRGYIRHLKMTRRKAAAPDGAAPTPESPQTVSMVDDVVCNGVPSAEVLRGLIVSDMLNFETIGGAIARWAGTAGAMDELGKS